MTPEQTPPSNAPIVVTGANGFVGSSVCAALVERAASLRAVARRAGTAPRLLGVEEVVGDIHDPAPAARACSGARAVVNTVHPMQDDDGPQESAVRWAAALAEAAGDAAVPLFVHVSTTSVYEREADTGGFAPTSGLAPTIRTAPSDGSTCRTSPTSSLMSPQGGSSCPRMPTRARSRAGHAGQCRLGQRVAARLHRHCL